MAQPGFTAIVPYNTITPATLPSAANLVQGEIAINLPDKRLYAENAGAVVEIGTNPTSLTVAQDVVITGDLFANGGSHYPGGNLGQQYLFSNPGVTQYYLLATLPVSTVGTYDAIHIDAGLGAWTANTKAKLSIILGNRDGFSQKSQWLGSPRTDVGIRCYTSAGVTSVYLAAIAGSVTTATLNITQSIQATIVTNPVLTTTTPTGTLVYDSMLPATYPPLSVLDNSGNLGVGVVPSSFWDTSFGQKAIQVGPVGSISSLDAGSGNRQLNIGNNLTEFVSAATYLTSDFATSYRQLGGSHLWQTAPSGTAGSAVSASTKMLLTNGGNLLVGTTTDPGGSGNFVAQGALTVANGASTLGNGLVMTANNAQIELGLPGTSNTPFLDFHSSSTSTDYDSRLIASGGSGATGQGTLQLFAATFNVFANTVLANGGSITPSTTPSATEIGYLGTPQNAQPGSYTFVLADRGKDIFHDSTAATYTIPANASVAFPIGTIITITNNNGAGAITLAITTDILRRGDGVAGTGSRTIPADAVAAIKKTKATEWMITGKFS